ncbi:MAG: XdhC family protein [Cyclobacteriaceae bacterium]|jgi:xanthine dehydrogenase accessory factor|nr:XdhC family protein [Cyclobacteriaceae bacterium]
MLTELISDVQPPYALAMVVNRVAPSSGKPGDKAVILPDGTMKGWIGGGCTRGIVLKEALLAIQQGKPRLVNISPGAENDPTRKGVVTYNMTCQSGGSVDVYIEPVLPKPHILIMGRSHISMALCKLSKVTGYQVTVVAFGADKITFPEADRVIDAVDLDEKLITPNTYIIVCTQGEGDDIALKNAIESGASYVSFVSSMRKANSIYNSLKKQGIKVEELMRVKTPAGLNINAKLPEEVAISILAEIISKLREEKNQSAQPESQLNMAEYFINPVCNIPVQKSTAKHVINRKGVDYYFCCDGCRDTFVAQPEKYELQTV